MILKSSKRSQFTFEQKIYRNRRKYKLKIKQRKIRMLKLRKKNYFDNVETFKYRRRLISMYPLSIRELVDKISVTKDNTSTIVKVPRIFSFKENFNESIYFFRNLLSSFIYGKGDLVVKFTNCEEICISTFSLFHILMTELIDLQKKYNRGLFFTTKKRVKILPSLKNRKTNKYLHAFNYRQISNEDADDSYYLPLFLKRGKGRNCYTENIKSTICKHIVEFVCESVHGSDCGLSNRGVNAIERFLSEVLSNAEDHSISNSEWYVDGISFREKQHGTDIVELNLSIINLGLSMFEGFEATKVENKINYSKVEKIYEQHKALFTSKHYFEKESLFMLYMLNEGISRLKYLESSRGNGTMQFIEAFIILGIFGETNPKFNSQLNIISGHSVLTCDNVYKPYIDGSFRKLSLNREKTLSLLPDKNNLRYNEEYFPGTMLECKIYLNKNFFKELLNKNDER